MSRKRLVLLCPGRGAYTKRSLRTLPADHAWVHRAEALRAGYGLEPLLALDGSERWRSAEHLRPDNVSPLIWLHSMLDAEQARREGEVVAVAGNSMGWYTALAVAGALSFEDGFRLVQEMATLQMEHVDGGQILYPVVDEHWRIDPRMSERIATALDSSGGEAFPSIDLGGYAVLAGSERGIEHLLATLPPVEMGPSIYPFRLAQHGPYHTPLLAPIAARAAAALGSLDFRAPECTLIDGRGACHTPWSADPAALREYTLGTQITSPYRFTTSIRVALREQGPDQLVLPGPGNTLGGVCGQVLAMEGWRGITCREEFESVQQGERPIVWSMRRA